MIDRIITICIALFLPLGLLIASRLLDRTESKKKDETITTLTNQVSSLMSRNRNNEAKANVAEDVAGLAHSSTDTARAFTDLQAEAKKVTSLDEAIALAQKQIDRSNGR